MSASDMTLEAAAVEWLRYERRCMIVVLERGLMHDYRPDVFAVTRARLAVEVECKRTLADFKADAAKRITSWRRHGALNVSQFYYIVPPSLVEAVRPLVPEYAGLLTVVEAAKSYTGLPKVQAVARAPVNKAARRLSAYEMGRMVMHQTATMQRLLVRIVRQKNSQETSCTKPKCV